MTESIHQNSALSTAQTGSHSLYLPDHLAPSYLQVSDAARSMGVNVMAGKGSGKSTLLSIIAFQDFLRGVPTLIFDPIGGTLDAFLGRIICLPKKYQERIWPRIVYVDASGSNGSVVPFPLYYRLGSESLYEISQRYLDVVRKLDIQLQQAPILGWNMFHRVGSMTGMVLAALGIQITEAEDLLMKPEQWESRFNQAVSLHTECLGPATYFRSFAKLKEYERELRRSTFLTKTAMFSGLEPTMTAMFGASQPGIDWRHVIANHQIVLFDFRNVHDLERRRFLMWWYLGYFLTYIKTRGHGRHQPIGLIIDELTALLNFQTLSTDAFVQELDTLINVIARSHRIWLTTALQEAWQVDNRIVNSLMTMGTQIIGHTSDPKTAQLLAEHLFRYDPARIKKWERVWMSDRSGAYVVDHKSVEYTPEEQTILNSYTIQDKGLFRFLVRPAAAEGEIGSRLENITIAGVDNRFWQTGDLIITAREQLSKASGTPVATILDEIEKRRHRVITVKSTNHTSHNDILPKGGDSDHEREDRIPPSTKTSSDFWDDDE